MNTATQTKPFVMQPGHPLWYQFCDRLGGPEACDFQDHPTETCVWKCDHQLNGAKRILADMGADVQASLAFFVQHGGGCDCEILFNVDLEPRP